MRPAILFPFFLFLSLTGSAQNWEETLMEERALKNDAYRSITSPLDKKEIKHFKGLVFYPANEVYRITAEYHSFHVAKKTRLKTNDGAEEEFIHPGYVNFSLGEKKCTLQVFTRKLSKEDTLITFFIPFSDSTSLFETHPAGRYLRPQMKPGSTTVLLDFNRAENSLCAYSRNYRCVLPPEENRLGLKVAAGEKFERDSVNGKK